MNLLSKSDVFAENKLFATLDTTTRKLVYENMPFLMSDTVGFIRKLPHHLVESFKSTLDEVRESDLLLHVVDISHPRYEEQIGVVKKTLQEINAYDKPVIYVFNKMDRYEELNFDPWLEAGTREELLKELKERWEGETQSVCVFMSATTRANIDGLREVPVEPGKGIYKERFPYRTEYSVLTRLETECKKPIIPCSPI